MRVFVEHRGGLTPISVGYTTRLAGDPRTDPGIVETTADGAWRAILTHRDETTTLYLVPGSLPTRLVRAGAASALPPGANLALAMGDVLEIAGDAVLVGYRARALPTLRPLDDRERALLADPDDDRLEVLRDHWEQLGEDRDASDAVSLAIAAGFDLADPRAAMRAPLLLEAGEPLIANEAIFRASPRVYVADQTLAGSYALRLVSARAHGPNGPGARVAIRCAIAASLEATAYLERARRIVARFAHPNLERYVGMTTGRTGDGIVFAWGGSSLASAIESARSGARSIARQLLLGIAHAHAHGVVHGNINPQRVCIADDGTAMLIGFADARVADAPHWSDAQWRGGAEETRFQAPERIAGEEYDERADLYSIGMVLAELAGTTDPLVRRLTQRDPADRPPRATAALALLE